MMYVLGNFGNTRIRDLLVDATGGRLGTGVALDSSIDFDALFHRPNG